MKKVKPCQHLWTDLYQFRTNEGERYVQQKCDYCKIVRYVPVGKNGQNDSKK